MKLTDLGVIFASVFICFSTVWGINTASLNSVNELNRRYNQAVDNAVTDGLYMFVELDDGENIKYNVEESKKQFFMTLGINLNMSMELNKLEEYVPVLCYLLPEGFYIYHNSYTQDSSNKMIREYVLSDFYNYYREDQYYEYCFTLSDEIWIRNKKTMEVYQGKPKDISKYCSADFLKNNEEYERVRKAAIVENVMDKITHYANEHNLYGKEMGIEYEFVIPDISDATWVRTFDNPGIMAFVQGFPYGGNMGSFSKVAFGGARLYKKG